VDQSPTVRLIATASTPTMQLYGAQIVNRGQERPIFTQHVTGILHTADQGRLADGGVIAAAAEVSWRLSMSGPGAGGD